VKTIAVTFLVTVIAVPGLLVLSTSAFGQDDERRRAEERYHQGARDEGWWRGRLFERVRADLDHVQAVTFRFSPDQYRLSKVKTELNELQEKYAARAYSQPELDDVIDSLQRVVADNHLSERDRDALRDDLSHLREFREHHEGYR
jgi:hypothetical protein